MEMQGYVAVKISVEIGVIKWAQMQISKNVY